MFLKKNFFLYITLLLTAACYGQVPADSLIVKADTIRYASAITKSTDIFIDSILHVPVDNIPKQHFIPLSSFAYTKGIPRHLVTKPAWLRFTLQNPSKDSLNIYFFPGMLYSKLALYKKTTGQKFEKLYTPDIESGFVFIKLAGGETTTYFLEMQFCKTDFNKVMARLIEPNYLPTFKLSFTNSIYDKTTVGFILCGVLLIMFVFTLVNYFLRKKIEFLYYCLYSLCIFILIFLFSYLNRDPGEFNAFFISYFALFLLMTGTIFYVMFTRKFLNTKREYPELDILFKTEAWLLGILMVVYTILHYTTDLYSLQHFLEIVMKIIALVIGLLYIIIGLGSKDKLMHYLALGNAMQIFFSIISLTLILANAKTTSIFTSALFYFETGIIVSIFYFLLGLTYKTKQELIEKIKEQEMMKLEVEKQVFETRIAIIHAQQEERNRISADMHDDLGAGMTTIRLYSELAKNKMGDNQIPEIEKISASADELLNKMNAIIWSMSSSNDTLGNMVAYIRSYSLEYLENTGIECHIDIPQNLPALEVNGEIRRNVFLVVKEALNNIVKHSGATIVKIILQKEPDGLSLVINDNGKGINPNKMREFGNGLTNMKKRMNAVDIHFSIENDNGTSIKLYRKTKD